MASRKIALRLLFIYKGILLFFESSSGTKFPFQTVADGPEAKQKARFSGLFCCLASSDVPLHPRVLLVASSVLGDWIDHLKSKLWFGPDDPLFPVTKVALTNAGLFGAVGLSRDHWKNASAIRRIFKSAFEAAGLPYANPHSLRNTLVLLGQQRCRTPEAFKAWSQNPGHEQVLTTFSSHGTVATNRQAEIITQLCEQPGDDSGLSHDAVSAIAAILDRERKKA